uniref:Sulfatase domain-containing protein n=1 Tax=Panagrellus redivivus TaxID=6233 RepID=A0A7E4W301_PANRE
MNPYSHIRQPRSLRKRLLNFIYFSIVIWLCFSIFKWFRKERFADVEYGQRLLAKLNATAEEFYYSNQTCRFPILNPYDSSILKFTRHPRSLKCDFIQPDFTFALLNKVYLNTTVAAQYNLHNLQYRHFTRANGTDSSVFYHKWKPFPSDNELSLSGYSGATLKGSYNESNQYSFIYASVEPLYGMKKQSSYSKYRPNVLIIGIDSVSRSNVIRNLPLTYKYLTEITGGWDFRGYAKIEDNTFPNMNAVLTGYKAATQTSELPEDPAHEFVDQWPFIWKNYSEIGYTTLLAEEQPGIFSYKAPGFKKQPTDVYLRSFGRLMNDDSLYKSSSPYCYSNLPEAVQVLNTIERFMAVHDSYQTPYFAFSFLWKLSHDSTSEIERLDTHLASWIERIHRQGLLRNTLFFVTSDHGNRFDDIRSTLIGRYEERMPFLFLRPPEAMLRNYAQIEKALTRNLYRLSCHFDFYETLVDVVLGEFGDESRPRFKNRGRSLFTEIPESRTCEDVDIEEHFCVCQEETVLPLNDSLVTKSLEAIIQQINTELKNASQLCMEVALKEVLAAEKLSANEKVKNNNRYDFDKLLSETKVANVISFVRVTLKATPNDAIFEGVVQITQTSADDPTIISATTSINSISRINAYGQAANCVSLTHRYLEKFCTCIEPLV